MGRCANPECRTEFPVTIGFGATLDGKQATFCSKQCADAFFVKHRASGFVNTPCSIIKQDAWAAWLKKEE
jgi:hypothetical protein